MRAAAKSIISDELRSRFATAKSVLVLTGAGVPEIARAAGAYVVEVNPEPTPLSGICHDVLTGKAGEILPLIG